MGPFSYLHIYQVKLRILILEYAGQALGEIEIQETGICIVAYIDYLYRLEIIPPALPAGIRHRTLSR
jgi:hypothetical protein